MDAGDSHSTVSSGWEKMLASLISAGCSIQGTWPIRTEQTGGLREAKRNALASSIVWCAVPSRRRPSGDPQGVHQRPPSRITRRAEESAARQHCAGGPCASGDRAGHGRLHPLRQSVGERWLSDDRPHRTGAHQPGARRSAGRTGGEFDTDTRWALAWFEQFGIEEGPFGVAETLSRAKNTAVNGLVEAGIAKARGGKVQLLKREELPEDWEPGKDKRLTIWEVTQHLMRTLGPEGRIGGGDPPP